MKNLSYFYWGEEQFCAPMFIAYKNLLRPTCDLKMYNQKLQKHYEIEKRDSRGVAQGRTELISTYLSMKLTRSMLVKRVVPFFNLRSFRLFVVSYIAISFQLLWGVLEKKWRQRGNYLSTSVFSTSKVIVNYFSCNVYSESPQFILSKILDPTQLCNIPYCKLHIYNFHKLT